MVWQLLSVQGNAQHWTEYKITLTHLSNVRPGLSIQHLWSRLWHHFWTNVHQLWNVASLYHGEEKIFWTVPQNGCGQGHDEICKFTPP